MKPESNVQYGLTVNEESEINSGKFFRRPIEEKRIRFQKLRQKYQNDALTLEIIDRYDPESPYILKQRELVQAHQDKDSEKIDEILKWMKVNYPLSQRISSISSD